MSLTRGAAAAAVAAVLAVLAGCGPNSPGPDSPGPDSSGPGGGSDAWRTASDPVATGPVVWESDGVVHLSDGTDIDLGALASSYVVAGDGVFFVPAEDASEVETGSQASEAIHFATPDEKPVDTGLRLRADTLGASPEGRYLVGIDLESGPKDDYGTPLAELVVLDLVEGRETARTSEGLGDTSDDLTDLYEDAEISLIAVTDSEAYVDGVSGPFAVELATGSSSDKHGAVLLPELNSPDSPDGRWSIESGKGNPVVVDEHGDVVPLDLDAPRWRLDWWADPVTVIGIAGAEDGSSALLSCVLPDGHCEVHEESRGASVRFPNGPHNLVTNYLD